jgi:thioredoxin 1
MYMQRVFDTVLASSDLSLERVLNAGLPVALIFYEREIPAELRQSLDDLARRYAGRALVVTLSRGDASQAASRFGVRQNPTLVTVREGKALASLEGVGPSDLGPYMAHLLGEGPLPASRVSEPGPAPKRNTAAAPVSVNESGFNREVLQSDRPVLVDFWAPWCAPCRMVAPTLEKLAAEQSNLKIAKVNVDENPGLASKYRAMSIPTMIVVQGGREVDRWVGAMPENMLRSRVARWTQG